MFAAGPSRSTSARISRNFRYDYTRQARRFLSTGSSPENSEPRNTPSRPPKPPRYYEYQKPAPPPETWLTRYLKQSPRSMALFQSMAKVVGMGSSRQLAGRRSYFFYQESCATREKDERTFWHEECRLPPTFQTWFTITNLHVWILTVRLRALPSPYGQYYVQGLLDHFFLDVEDRIRVALDRRAPERLVGRQMKVFREQWAGLGLAFDVALGHSISNPYSRTEDADAEMAAAVWRNLLGARGALGIDDPGRIRHAVNLTGEYGKQKISKDKPEDTVRLLQEADDFSGVHDFVGEETQLYVQYPELMYALVKYVRSELSRLEAISDEEITNGDGVGHFGPIVCKKSSDY